MYLCSEECIYLNTALKTNFELLVLECFLYFSLDHIYVTGVVTLQMKSLLLKNVFCLQKHVYCYRSNYPGYKAGKLTPLGLALTLNCWCMFTVRYCLFVFLYICILYFVYIFLYLYCMMFLSYLSVLATAFVIFLCPLSPDGL